MSAWVQFPMLLEEKASNRELFVVFLGYVPTSDLYLLFAKVFNSILHFLSVFTEKYCTANHVDKLPGPRDWVQILQDQIKLARRRLKRGSGMKSCTRTLWKDFIEFSAFIKRDTFLWSIAVSFVF